MASKKDNSGRIKVIVILVCVFAVLAVSLVIMNIVNRIPENDPAISGNTPGNINNNGLFCENDGVVYFANPYDDGSLYSMNPDQTRLKRLYNSNCRNINAAGDYLYFSMESPEGGTGLGFVIKTSGIYRSTKKGSNIECLTDETTLAMSLVGNTLYYQASTGEGVGLKKISAIKKDPQPEEVEKSFVINPACSVNGAIYYGGTTDNHYLYMLNCTNDSVTTLFDGDVWNPVYDSGYFYYMDIADDYCICRYSQSAQTVEILTHDRVDNFNVGSGCVYYSVSDGDEPGLYRMNCDGSGRELIYSGYVCDINMTSTYTYFREYGTTVPMYCVPTTGSSQVSEFTAAMDAAEK